MKIKICDKKRSSSLLKTKINKYKTMINSLVIMQIFIYSFLVFFLGSIPSSSSSDSESDAVRNIGFGCEAE